MLRDPRHPDHGPGDHGSGQGQDRESQEQSRVVPTHGQQYSGQYRTHPQARVHGEVIGRRAKEVQMLRAQEDRH